MSFTSCSVATSPTRTTRRRQSGEVQGSEGREGAAGRDYQERMASIFAECRRVLKPDGLMTLMFTHKATGAWDALTKGLMKRNLPSPHHGPSIPRPRAACTSRKKRQRRAPFSWSAAHGTTRLRFGKTSTGRMSSRGWRGLSAREFSRFRTPESWVSTCISLRSVPLWRSSRVTGR